MSEDTVLYKETIVANYIEDIEGDQTMVNARLADVYYRLVEYTGIPSGCVRKSNMLHLLLDVTEYAIGYSQEDPLAEFERVWTYQGGQNEDRR